MPPYPKAVGLVTSGAGAAVRDMIHVLSRRWPGLCIWVWPVKVQGPGAAEEISAAIRGFNALAPETDVLLVGRGGGSIEDLWAFNEEPVARAIAESKIPVVSCVGHETDWTIADFVADVRAPTPSAAAELAVPEKEAVEDLIFQLQDSMHQCLRDRVETLEARLKYAAAHPLLQDPRRLWEQRAQRVDELTARLPDAIRRRLEDRSRAVDELSGRLPEALRRAVERLDVRLRVAAGKLDAISPLKVLGRGYAIAQSRGKTLFRASQVKEGDIVRVRLSEGEINCEVTS